MTQIFTGNGLGTHGSSLGLGSYGPKGIATLGQGGESVYVNAANGNLVVQQADGFLADMGLGLNVLQTYNSKGELNSLWRFNLQTEIKIQGKENTAGSILVRIAEDGHQSQFHYDVNKQKYLPDEGGTERIIFKNNEWRYQNADNKAIHYYNAKGQLLRITDHDGHSFNFSYVNDELVSITDKSGKQQITWTFQQGLLQDLTVTSEGKIIHHLHYEYNDQQQLHKVSRDLGQGKVYWITYDYVADSQWISDIRQSDGSSLHLDYDAQGRVKILIDGEGRKSIYNYEEGKTKLTNGLGETWTYYYDKDSHLTGVDGPEQYRIRYYYEGTQLSSVVQGEQLWRFFYNEQGDCIRIDEPSGQISERIYDEEHRLIQESNYQNFDGNHHPLDKQTIHYIYDELGHLRFVIKADGTVTEYRYDKEGQCQSSRTYLHSSYDLKISSSDKILTQEELELWVTQQNSKDISLVDYHYDWRGQLIEELHYTHIDEQGRGVVDGAVMSHLRYDAAGHLVEKSIPTDKGWSSTHYLYDDLGRLIETINNQGNRQKIEYDDVHQRIIQTDANGLQTIKLYDKSGLLISLIRLNNKQHYGTLEYQYDKEGRLIAETNEQGLSTYRFYNHLGQLQALVNTLGQVTEYLYNSDGFLIQKHQFQQTISTQGWLKNIPQWQEIKPSANFKDAIEQIIYKQFNQVAYRINTQGAIIAYEYNARGQMITSIAYAKRLKNYKPDQIINLSELTISADPADRKNTYYYDSEMRLQAKIDSEGYATEYVYDRQGNTIDVCQYAQAQTKPLTGLWFDDKPIQCKADIHQYFFYDARSLKIAEIDGEGYVKEYFYNDSGLVKELCVYEQRTASRSIDPMQSFELYRPKTQAKDHHTYYQYNDLNQVIEEKKQNGLVTTYSYDVMGNLSSKTLADLKTHQLRGQQYRYDMMGRLVQSLDELGVALLNKTAALSEEEIERIWREHGLAYGYDEAGLLISKTNASQQKTSYFYDDYARLQYTINADGAVEERSYTAFNQLESVRKYSAFLKMKAENLTKEDLKKQVSLLADSLHDELIHYDYNTLGQLIAKHTGSKGLSTSEYNAFGELERTSQRVDVSHQRITHYDYDKKGLLSSVTDDVDGISKRKSMAYDAFGMLSYQLDGRGNRRDFGFNRRGEQIVIYKESTGANGAAKYIKYDAFGRILAETNYSNAYVKQYSYDDVTNTITLVNADNSKVVTQFNSFGDKLSIKDANGYETHFEFNEKSQVIRIEAPEQHTKNYSYNALGQLSFELDSGGHSVAYTYDASGHVLTQINDPSGLKNTRVYQYDAIGRQLSIRDANNIQKCFSYDDQGNLIESCIDPHGLKLLTQFAYDDRGCLVRQTELNPQGKNKVIAYEWDNLERRSATIQDPDGLGLITRYQYDENDNLLCSTNAKGQSTRFIYDVDNQCRYQINPRGVVTEYSYNNDDTLKQTVAYANPLDISAECTISQLQSALKPDGAHDQYQFHCYDKNGRLIGSYDALGYYTEYIYDANANVVCKKNYAVPTPLESLKKGQHPKPSLAGSRFEYMLYNGLNHLRFKWTEGVVTETRYDKSGQLTSSTRYANPISKNNKDPLDISSMQNLLQPSLEDRTTCYAYNALGQLTKELSAQGVAKSYEYDALGHVVSSTQYATLFKANEDYDISNLKFETHAKDRTKYYLYDAAGRELYRISSEGRIIERRYDALGNVLQELHHSLLISSGPYTLERLKNILSSSESKADSTEYEYDARAKLLAEHHNKQVTQRFEYDAQGNVIKKTEANGARWTYSYDAANQLIEMKSPMIMVGQSRRSIITRSTYDGFGNLSSVIRDAEGVKQQTIYEYDLKNQKIKTIYPGVRVNNSGTKASTLREEVTKTLSEELKYNAFGQLIASSDKANHWTYSIYNELGQLRYSLNTLGAVTACTYNSFGEVVVKTRYASSILLASDYTVYSIHEVIKTSAYDREEQYLYNLDGQVISVSQKADRSYNAKTKQYNHKVQPTTQTLYNAFGDVIKLSAKINEKDWSDTFYYYDNDGKKTAEINAEQYLTSYSYNALGYMDTTTEWANVVKQHDLLGYSNPPAASHDRKVIFTYDVLGQLHTKTLKGVLVHHKEASGKYASINKDLTTSYSYDALGHLIATTDSQGNTAYCYYDELGQLTAKVAPKTQDGRAATTYTYDALGNLLETRKWADGAIEADAAHFKLKGESAQDQIAKQIFDTQGHLLAQTDALNHSISFSYDENGNLARSWQVLTQVDKTTAIQDKRYLYDSEKHVLQTKTFKSTDAFKTEDAKYNVFGELIAKGINSVYNIKVDYDNQGRVWRSNTQGYYQIYVYDLLSRVTQVVTASNGLLKSPILANLSDPFFENAYGYDEDTWHLDLQRQNNIYDALGNLTLQSKEFTTYPQGDASRVKLQTLKLDQSFDRWGNMLSFVNSKGLATHYEYNACNQLIKQELPFVSVMDELGVSHTLKPTNYYFYDELGRAIGMMDANQHTVSKEYDAAGHLLKEIDAKGFVRQKHYNLLEQLTSLSNELGGVTSYLYDKENRLISLHTPKTQQNYEYDALGQLIKQKNGAKAQESPHFS